MWARAFLGGLIIWILSAAMAQAKSTAFVVGINEYRHLPAQLHLVRARNDARSVFLSLLGLGIEAEILEDPSLEQFYDKWDKFVKRIEPGDVSIFYFAGHGVELDGTNYLLPSDIISGAAGSKILMERASVGVSKLIEGLREKNATAIVILDACRDNPFAGVGTRSVGGARGLAEPRRNRGEFVLYAAGAGESAHDSLPTDSDAEPNSLFTRVFLKYLNGPRLALHQLARRVREDVSELAHKADRVQVPAYYDGIISDVCLGGCGHIESDKRGPHPLSVVEEHSVTVRSSFKECDRCPEMIVVPGGRFLMGSRRNEAGRDSTEGPQLEVTFRRPFAVGIYPVTFEEWEACREAGVCTRKPDDWKWGRERRPVIDVSWFDALEFTKWLLDLTGNKYRLLSESEREYVTRAGTVSPFWWGDQLDPSQANFNGERPYKGSLPGMRRGQTLAVDAFKPNQWGLFGVHGNIAEWVEDCWSWDLKRHPQDGAAHRSGTCDMRTYRGGSWRHDGQFIRAAYRFGTNPNQRTNWLGFRVAREIRGKASN